MQIPHLLLPVDLLPASWKLVMDQVVILSAANTQILIITTLSLCNKRVPSRVHTSAKVKLFSVFPKITPVIPHHIANIPSKFH